MFCNRCGKGLDEGTRFCLFCGAEQGQSAPAGVPVPGGPQQPLPPAGAPSPRPSGGMKGSTIAIIAVILVLALAGLGVGLYFGLRNTNASKTSKTTPDTGTKQTHTTIPEVVVPKVKSEKLAYLNGKDIWTSDLSGASRLKVTSRGDIMDFSVAPDGSRIAFVASPGDTQQRIIFMMKPDGTGISQVTLPEKGLAENPAFDPTSKFIYFTRITPAETANFEQGSPYAEAFERYDIAANKVDHLYDYTGLQEQSINGLYADLANGDLYFNLYGSDWPSSTPYKLTLGPSPTATVYMPMQHDSVVYVVVAYRVTSFSRDGSLVSYIKSSLKASSNVDQSDQQAEDACYSNADASGEQVVARHNASQGVSSADQQGQVQGMEFSAMADSTYYLAKVQSVIGEETMTVDFFKGTGAQAAQPANLAVTVHTGGTGQFLWHLLPVK